MNYKILINNKIMLFVVCFILFCFSCDSVFATPKLNEQKNQIEVQRGHAKKEIHKLKLLEKIETNRLYRNKQKLEYTQHSLQRSQKEYNNAKNEVLSLEKKLDVLLVENKRHQAYTAKRLVQIYKHKRNNYIDFLLNSENSFVIDSLNTENEDLVQSFFSHLDDLFEFDFLNEEDDIAKVKERKEEYAEEEDILFTTVTPIMLK